MKSRIAREYAGDENAAVLFKNLLHLKDATYHDILEELLMMKSMLLGVNFAEKAFQIYEYLSNLVLPPEDWDFIRTEFEKNKLVYAHRDWYAPTSCLWTCPVQLEGTAVLQPLYKSLQSFFMTKLKSKNAEVGMLVQNLTRKLKEKESPSITDVKNLLLKIAEMVRSEIRDQTSDQPFEALKQVSFLPVRVGTEDPYLTDIHSDFAILDHLQYSELFASSARVLDFSQTETLQLHPLLTRLGLKKKCLSELVDEKPDAGSSAARDDNLREDFKARAYALYW